MRQRPAKAHFFLALPADFFAAASAFALPPSPCGLWRTGRATADKSLTATWAAARRAIGTRNGEQET